MNIAMVGTFGLYRKGTVRARALPLARALAARGHRVWLLVPPWDSPWESGCAWVQDGVQIIHANLPSRLPGIFHLGLTLHLVRQTMTLPVDVVHCFKPKGYAGLTHFVLWWLRLAGLAKPQLRLVVDEDDWEQAWNQIEAYSAVQKRFFAWQEVWGLRHADSVTVASQELRRLVAQTGVPFDRIFYVPNGVWPDAFANCAARRIVVRADKKDNSPILLLYSRFLEFRLERVVRILQQVVAHQPTARLLVVGKGLHHEEAELASLLCQAGLADKVTFVGWVASERLADYFAMADVGLFPFDDTPVNRAKCSVKLIELLAAGIPVVADAVGQNREYILDGESGLLVYPEDDQAFAEAVLYLLRDASLRVRLGTAAAQRIRAHFEWPRLVEEVERAYNTG
ncbi:MAG: glycosyltransferase family 4 protein [Anaerolineae bacterium]|nr:glycosyltransferase family 4 protein [Anaerolineae bacterium]MDW8071964.1 glycosyltransferase family 4 protein [Anaerolineae bacterium]